MILAAFEELQWKTMPKYFSQIGLYTDICLNCTFGPATSRSFSSSQNKTDKFVKQYTTTVCEFVCRCFSSFFFGLYQESDIRHNDKIC